MSVIYILNIMFVIFIIVYQTYYLSKFYQFGFINPISIDLIINFPLLVSMYILGPAFLIEDGLFDLYFNFAIFMTNISLVCKFILIYFILRYLKRKYPLKKQSSCTPYVEILNNRLAGLGIFFLTLFFISFILLSNSSFGFFNWIQDPRTGYQFYRSGAGQWFGLCITFISVSYVLLTLSLKKNIYIIISFFSYVFLVYFLGSKGFILAIAQYTLVLFWLRKYKHISRIIIILIPCAFLGMLVNFFSSRSEIDILETISYFDHFQHSSMYYEAYFSNKLDLFYGQIAFSNLWSLIPRALYESKPYVYGITLINEYFWPGAAEMTNTPAFGGPVEAFGDFGIVGVIVSSLLNVSTAANTVLSYFLYKNMSIDNIRQVPQYLYLFLWFFAPMLLVVFPFPLNIILFLGIITIISIGIRLRW